MSGGEAAGAPYLGLTEEEREEILTGLGVDDYLELEADIPGELRGEFEPEIPGRTEAEVYDWHREVAGENVTLEDLTCFLGGGVYDHFVPSTVLSFLGRSEFLTAYTPYQAELNQGLLQVLYEFQTMVGRLYGLPVTNASMYDGATALAEAVLMALNVTGRDLVYYSPNLYPGWADVLNTYLEPYEDVRLVQLPSEDGRARLPDSWSNDPAAVCMAYPNCWGAADRVETWDRNRPDAKTVGIAVSNPLSSALLEAPGELGWDVAVGEGQPLGLPLNGGAPGVGLFSAAERFLRRVPGRLVGETEDRRGNRCYVLTLQTREQHIRRGRATSNICTNHALMAIGVTVALATLGSSGLRSRARKNYKGGQRLAQEFEAAGYNVLGSPVFNEVAVKLPDPPENLTSKLRERGWLGGYFREGHYVCAATEQRSETEVEAFVRGVDEIVG